MNSLLSKGPTGINPSAQKIQFFVLIFVNRSELSVQDGFGPKKLAEHLLLDGNMKRNESQPDLPKILEYQSASDYLRDYYAAKKKGNPLWSYRVWARTLGIKSHSTLAMITQGGRTPSYKTIVLIARAARMDEVEMDHFIALVTRDKIHRLTRRNSPLNPSEMAMTRPLLGIRPVVD